MRSTEKLALFLEQMQDLDNDELSQAMPFLSPLRARAMIAGVSRAVPQDPDVLDGYLGMAMQWMSEMQSDPPVDVAPPAAPDLIEQASDV